MSIDEHAIPEGYTPPEAFADGMTTTLRFTLNGRKVARLIDMRENLADVLRNELGMTSVKKGCEVGECGACAVLVDGESVDSCIYLAIWVEGCDVRTTESLTRPDGSLGPVQQAFVDNAAVQCGFCTPGIIMATQELAETGRDYTREELRRELAGHLCRCTGYDNILTAMQKGIEAEHAEQA